MTLSLNIATLTPLKLIVLRWLRKQTQRYQPLSGACLSPSADYLLPLMHRTHRATVVPSRQQNFLESNVGQMQRSRMRRFRLKLLQSAAGSVATITLTAHAFAAPTVTVSVGGQSYNVTYTDQLTSYNASTALIQSQPWWGSSSRAESFATAVGTSLGLPFFNSAGPLFAYANITTSVTVWYYGGGIIREFGVGLLGPFFYATATLASSPSIPTTESSTPVTSDIVAGTSFGLSGIGVTANPVLAGGTLVLNRGDSSSVSIAITSAGGTIQAPTSGSAILSGVFSGSGGLTFTTSAGMATGGTGTTIVLSGANTYSGGTTVSGGTLVVAGPSPTGTGDVFVASAGTLMGTGTIAGNGLISGVLKPGNSPGYLSFTQNLTLNAGSTYQQDIAGATQASSATPVGASGYYSFVNVGSQLTITPGATLTPRLSNLFSASEAGYGSSIYVPVLGDKFRVITAGGITGRFTTLTQPAELSSGTQFIAFYNVNSSNSLDLVTVPTSYSTTVDADRKLTSF